MFEIITNICDIVFLALLLFSYIRSHYDHKFHQALYDIEFLCKEKAELDNIFNTKIFDKYLKKIPELVPLLKCLEAKIKDWNYDEILEEIDHIKCLYFMRTSR